MDRKCRTTQVLAPALLAHDPSAAQRLIRLC